MAGLAAAALALTACGGNGPAETPAPTSDAPPASSEDTESEPEEAPLEIIDVNFGYIADYNGTSLLAIAEDQGIWDAHGLNVTTLSFNNGPLQIQALGTGDLDFGYIGPGAFWLPASGQADIIVMNTLGTADRVIAQPGINSMEDLRGKTVAVPEGTSGDMILTLALENAGMTKADIQVMPMDASGVVTAFASGQVDAAGLWYPAISTIKEQVPDLVELAKNQDFSDTVAFPNAFVTAEGFADRETEMVERVTKALRDAIDWRYNNQEEAISVVATFLALTEDQVRSDAQNVQVLSLEELDEWSQDGTVDEWLVAMQDYFIDAEKLTEALAPSDFYLGQKFVDAGN